MNISFHKAWKLPASHDERQRLTELRAVCTLEVGWGGCILEPAWQPFVLVISTSHTYQQSAVCSYVLELFH
jgi:hypothetical protein